MLYEGKFLHVQFVFPLSLSELGPTRCHGPGRALATPLLLAWPHIGSAIARALIGLPCPALPCPALPLCRAMRLANGHGDGTRRTAVSHEATIFSAEEVGKEEEEDGVRLKVVVAKRNFPSRTRSFYRHEQANNHIAIGQRKISLVTISKRYREAHIGITFRYLL